MLWFSGGMPFNRALYPKARPSVLQNLRLEEDMDPNIALSHLIHKPTDSAANFAKWLFRLAGIYGMVVLLPLYFLEFGAGLGLGVPVPFPHPEHFYGFIGVALAWQFVFIVIAQDVRRYRPLMLCGIVEKFLFGFAMVILYVQGRVGADVVSVGGVDLALGLLFVIAFRVTRGLDTSLEVNGD